jgi:pyruvate/2-oxoacid:ferredoxin oxidoreductase beta subunit
MPTKQELYKIIQVYRESQCPKLNINSSKKELQIAVLRIQRIQIKAKKSKSEPVVKSTKPVVKSTKPVVKSTKSIDGLQKEIDNLREKAGRIAEREGRITSEVKKMLETIDLKTRERLQLRKELKSKKT